MQLFKILQEIKRRRVLVALVVLASFAVGFLLAFKPGFPPQSRQYKQAIASRILLHVDVSGRQMPAPA